LNRQYITHKHAVLSVTSPSRFGDGNGKLPRHGRPIDSANVPSTPARRDEMDVEARRNLQALEAIAEDDQITQRTLSARLGIALGLTNLYLKRLVRKGYVKCINVQSNRLRYLLTPKGIAEKTRLTYEFIEYSLFLYGQVRQQLRAILEPCVRERRTQVAVYGTGEAAELAYLSITELGLDLVAIFDGAGTGRFLGRPVRHIAEHRDLSFDLLIVATLDRPESIRQYLIDLGVDPQRLVTIRR